MRSPGITKRIVALLLLFISVPQVNANDNDPVAGAPSASQLLQAKITTPGLLTHLQALDDIARSNGGNRAFGLPGYAASVDYIWSHVSDVPGTLAWKQDFSAPFEQVVSLSLSLKIDNNTPTTIPVYPLAYSPSTPPEGITAEIVHGPEGLAGCNDTSYSDLGLDVKGKIVLIQRWNCGNTTLAGRLLPAARNGAVAVVIYNNQTEPLTGGTLTWDNPAYVPGGFVQLEEGLRIKSALLSASSSAETETGKKVVKATFQFTRIAEARKTQNVFVETLSGDPDNVIVLGAHLDSVQAGPGINDDGSGTALILELFRAITSPSSPSSFKSKTKIRFAFWAAEEEGLLGSRHYCQSLSTAETNAILAYLNFDMVSRGYFGVGDADGSAHGIRAPLGSEVIEQMYEEYYSALGLTVTPARLSNSSDYAPFWRVLNKPFGYLHTGAGPQQDPCYHAACDGFGNVNSTVLTVNAKVCVYVFLFFRFPRF